MDKLELGVRILQAYYEDDRHPRIRPVNLDGRIAREGGRPLEIRQKLLDAGLIQPKVERTEGYGTITMFRFDPAKIMSWKPRGKTKKGKRRKTLSDFRKILDEYLRTDSGSISPSKLNDLTIDIIKQITGCSRGSASTLLRERKPNGSTPKVRAPRTLALGGRSQEIAANHPSLEDLIADQESDRANEESRNQVHPGQKFSDCS